MTDRDPFRLETSSGMRPATGLGERVLVGLAVVALVSGGAVGVSNVLRGDPATADASGSPSASPHPTPRSFPTPTPRPLRIVQLASGTLPRNVPQVSGFSGWIRTTRDVVIRADPDPTAQQLGILAAGQIGTAYEQQPEETGRPGWLELQDPLTGWVLGDDGITRYTSTDFLQSGWVNTVAAGPDGFVALGTSSTMTSHWLPPFPLASRDGAAWVKAGTEPFAGWDLSSVVWGPAGWLASAATYGDSGESQIWLWNSRDGVSWRLLGSMGSAANWPDSLTASQDGYLLVTESNGGLGGGERSIWYSTDGSSWQERATPPGWFPQQSWMRIVGSPGGFFAWGERGTLGYGAVGNQFAGFTADGQSWAPVTDGPQGQASQVLGVNGGFLALDSDSQTGTPRAWTGALRRGRLEWRRETGADAALAGGVVTSMAWDGQQAYAFGWDRSTEAPLVWTINGSGWTRAPLPASFGAIPTLAAAGPAGVVVVGHRPSLRGDNPRFWRRDSYGEWLPEAQPIIERVPDPATDHCPALPNDLPGFLVLDRAAAVVCFGTAPITVRGYSVSCGGCSDPFDETSQPAWLAGPGANQLFLKAIAGNDGGWDASVVLSPSVAGEPDWVNAWVEVTGHFDDPAAATCHHQPRVDELAYWSGQQSFIDGCRQAFVVTRVSVVSGP